MKNESITRHPLLVALFSGILLAIIGFLADMKIDEVKSDFIVMQKEQENSRIELENKNNLAIQEKQSKLDEIEEYIDVFSLSSSNYYSSVENYILAKKENSLSAREIFNSIKEINYKRAPLFAVLSRIKASDLVDNNKMLSEKIEEYFLLILDITTECQKLNQRNLLFIRNKLDQEFTGIQNWIISELHKSFIKIRKS